MKEIWLDDNFLNKKIKVDELIRLFDLDEGVTDPEWVNEGKVRLNGVRVVAREYNTTFKKGRNYDEGEFDLTIKIGDESTRFRTGEKPDENGWAMFRYILKDDSFVMERVSPVVTRERAVEMISFTEVVRIELDNEGALWNDFFIRPVDSPIGTPIINSSTRTEYV